MKNILKMLCVLVLSVTVIFPSHNVQASTLSDILIKIEQLQNQVAELKAQLQSAVTASAGTGMYKETMFPRFIVSNITNLGTRGQDVATLQSFLVKQGYLSGSIDGVFGRQTEQGVKNFQIANKLVVDGKIGSVTRALVNKKITEASYKIATDRPVDDGDDTPGYPYQCEGSYKGEIYVYYADFDFEGQTPEPIIILASLTDKDQGSVTCVPLATLSGIGNNNEEFSFPDYTKAPKIDTLSSKGSSLLNLRETARYVCTSTDPGAISPEEVDVDFGNAPAPQSFTSSNNQLTWTCNKK